jgi:hypothetical protein
MATKKPSSLSDVVDETLKALRRNRFDAVYVRSREEALQRFCNVFHLRLQ